MNTIEVEGLNYGGSKLTTVVVVNNQEIDILASLFIVERAIQSKALNSLRASAEDLCTFLSVVYGSTGGIGPKDVTREQMHAYIYDYLQKQKGLSESSIRRHCATLGAFYEWMYSAGFIDRPKQFLFPKSRSASRDSSSDVGSKYITFDELLLLKANVSGKSAFVRARNELVLDFGYFCGLRAHEVTKNFSKNSEVETAVMEAQANSEESYRANVIGKGGKIRTIVIPAQVQVKILQFMKRRNRLPEGHLICSEDGLALNDQFASSVFSDAVLNMGYEDRQKFKGKSFHCLRHSYATNIVTYCHENGRDPQAILPDLMGHSDYQTTLKYVAWEAYLNNRIDIVGRLSLAKSRDHRHG